MGDHLLSCLKLRIDPHNAIRDRLFGVISAAMLRPKLEELILPGSKRRLDILVRHGFPAPVLVDVALTHSWYDGKLDAATAYEQIKRNEYGSD